MVSYFTIIILMNVFCRSLIAQDDKLEEHDLIHRKKLEIIKKYIIEAADLSDDTLDELSDAIKQRKNQNCINLNEKEVTHLDWGRKFLGVTLVMVSMAFAQILLGKY